MLKKRQLDGHLHQGGRPLTIWDNLNRDLKIRNNKYGTDAKEATTLDGNIENSEN